MAEGKPSTSQGAVPKTTQVTLDTAEQGEIFARRGFEMCQARRYRDAVEFFTRAIRVDRSDHRYFGNRSYAFSRLGEYYCALRDADIAVSLEPGQPKCHFLRGLALSGLNIYGEAQEEFEKTIELDPDNKQARLHLDEVRVRQIVKKGFSREQAVWALEKKHNDVRAAVEALRDPFSSGLDIRAEPSNPGRFRSVWVGNIGPEVTLDMLSSLFTAYGAVQSIRILHDRRCAFINYTEESSAAKAMVEVQGKLLCGASLVIRFPERKIF